MSGMLENEGKHWVMRGRKHNGKRLEDVAKDDPSFLTWLWSTISVFQHLSKEAVDALQSIMEKEEIPFEKPRKEKR